MLPVYVSIIDMVPRKQRLPLEPRRRAGCPSRAQRRHRNFKNLSLLLRCRPA
jgi:hypothetical protein